MDERGHTLPKCPALEQGECPRPHDKQTCLDVWKYDEDFRDRLDSYVQVVKRNNHRVPSKEQLRRAGIVPDWKKDKDKGAKAWRPTLWRQQPERPRSVDSSRTVIPFASRTVNPFRDRSSSTTDRRGAAYMAVLEGSSSSWEEASYQSSTVNPEPDGIYRLDLSTGQLTEVEVEAPEEAVAAAAEQLAGAMLQGAEMFSNDQDRNLALDEAPAQMLRLATSLEAVSEAQDGGQSEDEEAIEISSSSSDDSALPLYRCATCCGVWVQGGSGTLACSIRMSIETKFKLRRGRRVRRQDRKKWIEQASKCLWLSPHCSTEVQALCVLMCLWCACRCACGSEIESETRASVAI